MIYFDRVEVVNLLAQDAGNSFFSQLFKIQNVKINIYSLWSKGAIESDSRVWPC